MRTKSWLLGAAFGAAAILGASQSSAQTSFSATYYTVSSTTPDFNGPPCGVQDCGQVYTNNANGEVTTTLGPDGLPVYNTGFGGEALLDIDPTTKELQWWSGTPDNSSPIILTSLNNGALFPSNGTGGSDSNGFQTATFTGQLDLSKGSNVTFNMSSDDDTFLAVDGHVIAQDGGIHPLGTGVSVTDYLASGTHDVEVFYADRHVVAAALEFSESVTAVPEPATWAMMLVGFGGLGVAMRARRKQSTATA